jgi:DNA-binding response OmpR family regulator
VSLTVFALAAGGVLDEHLRRPLGAAGHELVRFDSAERCLAAAAATPPDVVLAPRRSGGGEAGELFGRLRALAPPPALVLLSPDGADEALARSHGAAFLRVPFSGTDLLEAIGDAGRGKRRILLVDDSLLIHRHTAPILEGAGYEVTSAMDGAEALQLVDDARPDLVITDVEMPALDGYALCRALKERPAPMPVIICSARGEAHDLERGFDAGADDYLVKPAPPEELLGRVRELLHMSGLSAGQRERLLVADDSPAIRHLLADSLSRQGFVVVTAEDGAQALAQLQAERFDMLITDYDMPKMTGFELVHAVKREPALRELPTLMLTARASRRDQAQMRAAGLTSYLVKPFAADKCVALVERLLAERRLIAYKEASRLYISEGTVRAAEDAARLEDRYRTRADEREVAVLFSDICGFTQLSSRLPPAAVVEILNDVFDVLCPILKEHGGDIDKFIGDAIMAVFEERPGEPPFALRAVRAALAMQAGLAAHPVAAAPELAIRVGINVGKVVRGDIGSRFFRRDYTVIGDVVNRAQRFESAAPRGGVLVGEATFRRTREHIRYEARPGLRLKGIEQPIDAWVALGEIEEQP